MVSISHRLSKWLSATESRMYGLLHRGEASRSSQKSEQTTEQMYPDRLFLVYPIAFALGSAAYMQAESEPSGLICGVMVLAIGLIALCVQGSWRRLCLLALCLALGGGAGKLQAWRVDAPRLYEATAWPVTIEGVVLGIEPGKRAPRLRLRLTAMEGLTWYETPRYVRVTHRSDLQVGPGRSVRCRVILSPPTRPVIPGDYNFARQAFFEQLGAVGFALGACVPAGVYAPSSLLQHFEARIGAARRALAQHVNTSAGARAGGMAAAMVSGDRSYIAAEDTEALRQSGLGHLLAISGLHMGLVAGLFYFLVRRSWPFLEALALRFPASKAAAIVALIMASLYLLMSGAAVSTQRAYIMVLVGMGAILCDRAAISLRSLALAMWIVTLLQPDSVVTPGYQMSFAASAALISLYENWPRNPRNRSGGLARLRLWSLSLLATSIVASLATAPFAAYHFGRVAMLSIPANMAAMPIISLVTVPAAGMAVLMAPAGLSAPGFALMGHSLEWVLYVAHLTSRQALDGHLPAMPVAVLIAFVLALALLSIGQNWLSRGVAILMIMTASLGWSLSPRAIAHVSLAGTIYMYTGSDWVWWRADNKRSPGLAPLREGKTAKRYRCADPECRLDTPAGQFILEQAGRVYWQAYSGQDRLELSVAEAKRRGGASLVQGRRQSKMVFSSPSEPPLFPRPWNL